MLRRFLDTRRDDADDLRAAHARGDKETIQHLAHSTIATAGTIGTNRRRLTRVAAQRTDSASSSAQAARAHRWIVKASSQRSDSSLPLASVIA